MDSETFKQFQKLVEDFHGGLTVAEDFHSQLFDHGLAHYISQIASLDQRMYGTNNCKSFGIAIRPKSPSRLKCKASQPVEALLKARNLVRYFDQLSPYNQAAFNSALLIWNSISEVPQDKRVKLLDSLNQFDIKRLWKISADRYSDNKETSLEMTTYSALNDLPTKPGEVRSHPLGLMDVDH